MVEIIVISLVVSGTFYLFLDRIRYLKINSLKREALNLIKDIEKLSSSLDEE